MYIYIYIHTYIYIYICTYIANISQLTCCGTCLGQLSRIVLPEVVKLRLVRNIDPTIIGEGELNDFAALAEDLFEHGDVRDEAEAHREKLRTSNEHVNDAREQDASITEQDVRKCQVDKLG